MKKFITITILIIIGSLNAQTTIYTAKTDGSKNLKNFYYFDHSSGKVYECFSCKDPSEKKRLPGFTIKIEGNKIVRIMDATEEKIVNGRFTEDKKIIIIKRGLEDSGLAPYIRDKKIYSENGNLLGFIEGKEIYGAAAYIVGQFR